MPILLIEDHEPNAQSYLRTLREAGYTEVHWVQDGITGLEAGVTDRYNAIIIDLDLPGLDGMHVGLAWVVVWLETASGRGGGCSLDTRQYCLPSSSQGGAKSS